MRTAIFFEHTVKNCCILKLLTMTTSSTPWQTPPTSPPPSWFIEAVRRYTPDSPGYHGAQLLWHRGHQDLNKLAGFLNPDAYPATSAWEFGQEMKWAIARLQKARQNQEKVTIWGDFDADGITSTSVLWEGLGQFFTQNQQLDYYIPNRLTESHGLNCPGIESLAASGTKLIVTCDTGSTNLEEITYAQELGIDIIVTDHHTLPEERPPVVAIINPRYFTENHPLYHLSGVAVAYKLVEAWYENCPEIPQQPLENLLDLVAIGLIADLVQLSGDCRYLAQLGIRKLQQQLRKPTRPGVASLLELCKRTGDRPTDISFGLGPRINAVSRIHGDATFCVELLTSRNIPRCRQLAMDAELANTRRKELQKNLTNQVKQKLEQTDLSTTRVIVLADSQWQGGILGLVAGQIAQEYAMPTILLSIDEETPDEPMARGSARSVSGIDLYQLVHAQSHLLHRFGGHPFAAGLSLTVANLPLFREAINQQLAQQNFTATLQGQTVAADLVVTVADLGRDLFRELKLLEPCGMGNPVPKLLIRDCWFLNPWHNNSQDLRGKKVQYIKSTFHICDDSCLSGFPGVWWGHYKDDIPENQSCDALVELDYNTYKERYEVRLVALNSGESKLSVPIEGKFILDWRNSQEPENLETLPIMLRKCPIAWEEIHHNYRSAVAANRQLALAYHSPSQESAQEVWQQLVGMAKYLSRTQKSVTLAQIQHKLGISDRSLKLGFQALEHLGFEINKINEAEITINHFCEPSKLVNETLQIFLKTVEEEQFLQSYFTQVPVDTLESIVYSNKIRTYANKPEMGYS